MGLPTNHRRVRVLAAALSAIVLASALSACGGGTEFTPNERSRAKGSTLAEAGVPEGWDLVTAPPAASNLHSVEIAGTTMTVDDEGGSASPTSRLSPNRAAMPACVRRRSIIWAALPGSSPTT
ncbi:MAG: hypothetical protein R2715_17060 [Ilumatobacteraceae bacterium]